MATTLPIALKLFRLTPLITSTDLPDIRSQHLPVLPHLPHLPFPYLHHHRSESYPPTLVRDLQESRRHPHRHTITPQ